MIPPCELLAPAGDRDSMRAAVGAGADAVYFGLDAGFNARAKAKGFSLDELLRVLEELHACGVRGYVTLNTLVGTSELSRVEELLGVIGESGADAVIVQDLGVAAMARAMLPELPIHASTQMTVTCARGAELVAKLGISRIILPRELCLEEIRAFRRDTTLELECFVHGALCISYSGQCLASALRGQGSANRGQCAQPCRLPYEVVTTASPARRFGYPLSPQDLMAYPLLSELLRAGVSSFKIEGRYKSPEYVAAAVESYRRALDLALGCGQPSPVDEDGLHYTFSRGFCAGFLCGVDHQALVRGESPGHLGRRVGEVVSVRGYKVQVRLAADAPALKAGDWMVFLRAGSRDEPSRGGIFVVGEARGGVLELCFGEPGPDLKRVQSGDELWKSHDSAVKRRLLRYVRTPRRVDIDVLVAGEVGGRLICRAKDALGRAVEVTGPVLERARKAPLGEEVLRAKLASFGDTPWRLRELRLELVGEVATSPKALKELRRELLQKLAAVSLPARAWERRVVRARELFASSSVPARECEAALVVLCRTPAHVMAALAAGADEVCLDLRDFTALPELVRRCRDAGARVSVAGARVEMPGEESLEEHAVTLGADGLLLRHLGALARARKYAGEVALHGDFSLNAANAVTGRWLLGLGLTSVTPALELDAEETRALLCELGGRHAELVLHLHAPMFYTRHCLYARHLSHGHDAAGCGRPCARHELSLRDDAGRSYPVLADGRCRNTVYEPRARSGCHVRSMLAMGVRRFRLELLSEPELVAGSSIRRARRMLFQEARALEPNLERARK